VEEPVVSWSGAENARAHTFGRINILSVPDVDKVNLYRSRRETVGAPVPKGSDGYNLAWCRRLLLEHDD